MANPKSPKGSSLIKGDDNQNGYPIKQDEAVIAGYGPTDLIEEEGENFATIIDLLFRRKWYLVAGFFVTLCITAIYSYTRVPQYESSSYVMVNLGNVTVDIGRSLESNENSAEGSISFFARSDRSLAGEIRLLEISDELVERVADRVRERMDDGLLGNEISEIPKGRVRFFPERGTDNIIRFTGMSSNAAHSATLANLYSEEYVKLTQDASRSHALAVREALEAKELENRTELNQIEEQIKRFKLAGTIALDQEASILVGQISQLDLERDNAVLDLNVERETLARLEADFETISPQIAQRISSSVEAKIATLQQQLAIEEETRAEVLLVNPELRAQETNALKGYDDRIAELRKEIDSLSTQWVNEVKAAGGITGSADGLSYVASLKQQIDEKRIAISRLQSRVNQLDSRILDYQQAMRNLPQQSMELAQLERSRMRVEQMYQNNVEQLQQAYIAEDSDPGYAQILKKAQIPRWSVYPDIPRNLIMGGFLGLLFGLALAVVRDKLDNRIHQSEQIRKMGLRELGVVPNMLEQINKNFGESESVLLNGHSFSTNLITYLNPVSTSAETYRHIRTLIQYGMTNRIRQTFLVTSPGMSEGKSTTAANLAIVMAQAGIRTLLVDADLRRPKLHKLFGMSLGSGLLELFSDISKFDSFHLETPIENLSLITAGMPPKKAEKKDSSHELVRRPAIITNPSELLGSVYMREIIEKARDIYDMIIIDTPPVMVATDAAVLSAQVDGTLLVVRANQTREGELELAVDALEGVGADILGVVLNCFDINMAYGHRYKYQKYGRFSEYGYYETNENS